MTDASSDRPQPETVQPARMPAGYQITVCPGCSTAFRVSEAQLKAAAGQVRCGMCLTLFDGVEALSTIAPVDFAQQKKALEALDNMVSELLADDRVVEPNTAPPVMPPQAPVAVPAAGAEEPGVPLLEPAALLPEAPAATVGEAPPPAEPQRFEPEPATAEHSEPVPSGPVPSDPVPSDPVPSDPAPGDPAPGKAVNGNLVSSTAASSSGEPLSLPVSKNAVSEGPVPKDAQPREASQVQVASTDASSAGPISAEVRAEAAALARKVSLRPPRGLWLGFVLVPLGLLLVASFAVWLQFDSLARSEFRPVLERICAGVGCELPERRALDQIKVESLTLGPAPDQPGKLSVRFLLVNKAPFEQRFPTLELRFSTVVGGLVAGHRFLPLDYLNGEAAALRAMPIDTPIQVEHIIPEPGSFAVNYTIDLR